MRYLAFDTSNYTTSAAFFDSQTGRGAYVSRLLPVPKGALGLRQSEAVFAHVKALPGIMEELSVIDGFGAPDAVAASYAPRAVKDSYMPCFLVGSGAAQEMSCAMNIPYIPLSHQQGHLAAAAYSAGRLDLLTAPFIAWHLSGGTTELLYAEPDGEWGVKEKIIGGTSDISAGQLIDRTGAMLGLAFPAGRELEKLADSVNGTDKYPVAVRDMRFSLSGMENKARDMLDKGETPASTADFIINTILFAMEKATSQALNKYPELPVLCSGGVASNRRIKNRMSSRFGANFASPDLSRDNAMGIAVLAAIKNERRVGEWING